jgi:hypothetical protein
MRVGSGAMAKSRKNIPLVTKLAAALLMLNPEDREHAKSMTAAQYLSLFQWDHAVLHAIEVNDHFTNLTPILIVPHRGKSRKDTSIVAKTKRLEAEQKEFRRKVLERPCGQKRELGGRIPSRPMRWGRHW